MNRSIARVIGKAAFGASLALGFAVAPHGIAHADTTTVTVTVTEDSPQWDCRYDGNHICGVGAVLPDGSLAIPGDYSDPNCWPGAIFCPDAGTPVDETVIGEA
jgi:hypothetical protein